MSKKFRISRYCWNRVNNGECFFEGTWNICIHIMIPALPNYIYIDSTLNKFTIATADGPDTAMCVFWCC